MLTWAVWEREGSGEKMGFRQDNGFQMESTGIPVLSVFTSNTKPNDTYLISLRMELQSHNKDIEMHSHSGNSARSQKITIKILWQELQAQGGPEPLTHG